MLTYLGPMWEEVLKTDTYATDAQGSLLPRRLAGNVVDGSAQGHADTALVGVANQFTSNDHYGPNPGQWFQRDDWSPVYYNKADSAGLGFDRSPTGSNLVAQYFPTLEARYGSIDTVPEDFL